MYSPIIALYVTFSNPDNCSNIKSKYALLEAICYLLKSRFISLLDYITILSTKKDIVSSWRELCLFGTPDAIRTHDPQSRSLILYPTELRAQIWEKRWRKRLKGMCRRFTPKYYSKTASQSKAKPINTYCLSGTGFPSMCIYSS